MNEQRMTDSGEGSRVQSGGWVPERTMPAVWVTSNHTHPLLSLTSFPVNEEQRPLRPGHSVLWVSHEEFGFEYGMTFCRFIGRRCIFLVVQEPPEGPEIRPMLATLSPRHHLSLPGYMSGSLKIPKGQKDTRAAPYNLTPRRRVKGRV